MSDYEFVNPREVGGPLEERFESIDGVEHGCHNCNTVFTISGENIVGQSTNSHYEKIMDGNGDGWIISLMCPECKYMVREGNWDDRI